MRGSHMSRHSSHCLRDTQMISIWCYFSSNNLKTSNLSWKCRYTTGYHNTLPYHTEYEYMHWFNSLVSPFLCKYKAEKKHFIYYGLPFNPVQQEHRESRSDADEHWCCTIYCNTIHTLSYKCWNVWLFVYLFVSLFAQQIASLRTIKIELDLVW